LPTMSPVSMTFISRLTKANSGLNCLVHLSKCS